MKFGGKSLATLEKVQKICKNIKKIYKNDKKIIIIVSAMGSTTDSLLYKSKEFCAINQPKRELDVLLSTGETQSSALFAMALNNIGVKAKSFQAFQLGITTFGDFLDSRIAYINKQPILDCFESGYIAVISGFQGINKNNEITTLGRGGSDITAAAIGAIFDSKVEIYSDFDGIFAGDPRKLNFKKIKNISYDSMKSIAESGSKVLEQRAVQVAKDFNLDIICKQSDEPYLNGSLVSNIEKSFISISTIDDLSKISINFSQDIDLVFIFKNVINILNNYKFYNLTLNNDELEFYVLKSKKEEIYEKISSKLNLLKNKTY